MFVSHISVLGLCKAKQRQNKSDELITWKQLSIRKTLTGQNSPLSSTFLSWCHKFLFLVTWFCSFVNSNSSLKNQTSNDNEHSVRGQNFNRNSHPHEETFLKPKGIERCHLWVHSVFPVLLSCLLVLNHRTVMRHHHKEGKMLAANMIQLRKVWKN